MQRKTIVVFVFLLVLNLGLIGIGELREEYLVIKSPFLSASAKHDLRKYFDCRRNKAFAASVTLNGWGWSSGHGDRAKAAEVALGYCEARGVKCLLYAVGGKIVWDRERARTELAEIVSSQADRGTVWRYFGEDNPHGIEVRLPSAAPSIISDYRSARGVLGSLRAANSDALPRHGGIDIIGEVGAPVLAAADGVVVGVDFHEIAGKFVRIAHVGSERQRLMLTEYIHLDEIHVAKGDKVRRGQRIGAIGATGRGGTPQRPHLHFETFIMSSRGNPHLFWHDGQGAITCLEADRTYSPDQTALTYPVPCNSKGR
jgi:murein DD-endopeptidase MepM/ murein hydrolase activator NlpD